MDASVVFALDDTYTRVLVSGVASLPTEHTNTMTDNIPSSAQILPDRLKRAGFVRLTEIDVRHDQH